MDHPEYPNSIWADDTLGRLGAAVHEDVVWFVRIAFWVGLALGAWLLFATFVLGWGNPPQDPTPFCEKSVPAFPAHPEWGNMSVPCDQPVP